MRIPRWIFSSTILMTARTVPPGRAIVDSHSAKVADLKHPLFLILFVILFLILPACGE